jgi:predicted metalloprotease
MRGRILVLVAVAFLAASCGDDGETSTSTATDEGPLTECPEGDFEGVFEREDMELFLECVRPSVEDWVDFEYGGAVEPAAVFYVADGVTGTSCDEPYDTNALKYCGLDSTIYLGQNALWEQYDGFGDAAPVTVLAHEMTHHLQNLTPGYPTPQEPNDQIPAENQADCGAGAFIAYANEQGFLDYPDDIEDLAGSLEAVGEAEGPQATHGTIEERLDSFDTGFAGDLATCNQFVPVAPIIAGSGTTGDTGTGTGTGGG